MLITKFDTIRLNCILTNLKLNQSLGYGAEWDQCGGQLSDGQPWTGSTFCQLGLNCFYRDQYYSQCMKYNPRSKNTKLNN